MGVCHNPQVKEMEHDKRQRTPGSIIAVVEYEKSQSV
jgi:hypothetical protein